MDIEMINKFLKVVISAVILSASGYASKATAIDIVSELSLTTYEWSATCYDCKDGNLINERPDDPMLWKEVTGSITLSDYTLGDDITSDNFYSFAYTGVSQFLPMFTVGTGESFDFTTQAVSGKLLANADLTLEVLAMNNTPAPRAPLYLVPPRIESLVEDYDADYYLTFMNALQSCSSSFSEPELDECYQEADLAYDNMHDDIADAEDFIRSFNSSNELLKAEYETELELYVKVIKLSVAPSDWSFGRFEGESLDIGSGFVVMGLPPVMPANQVSAPATLAIFALGLMGLGLRRINKQS
jgi:hypothetical protein